MSCKCAQLDHIELCREAVTERIMQTRSLKRSLELIAEQDGAERLLICPQCQQYWQSSCAWNWGGKEYLFKVPSISEDEWLMEPYVRPDELLIYSAMMDDYMERNIFIERETECLANGCVNRAVQNSVFCVKDHIASLQKAGALPKCPEGRWFAPYRKS